MQNTTNYNLNKPDGNDFAKIQALNENADIIDGKLKELEDASGAVDGRITTHLSANAVGAHKAKNIALEDVDGLFVGTEVETVMKELFTSVSNGKELIGTAITDVDDSLVVPTNPTHAQLADLIGNISTGKKWASGTVANSTNVLSFSLNGSTSTPTCSYFEVQGLTFTPSVIVANFLPNNASYTKFQILYSKDYNHTVNQNGIVSLISVSSGVGYKVENNAYVNNGSFRLPTQQTNTAYPGSINWIAFE